MDLMKIKRSKWIGIYFRLSFLQEIQCLNQLSLMFLTVLIENIKP